METYRNGEFRAFISAAYRALLQREPDIQEIETWLKRMDQGVTAADVLEEVRTSDEYTQLLRSAGAKLFVPPGHFYSPIVDLDEADRYLRGLDGHPVPQSIPGIFVDRTAMVGTWNELLPFMKSAPFLERPSSAMQYGFDNPAYAWGDGSILHAVLRLYRPKKIIEIGSGYSSACTFDTVKHFLDGDCSLTFVEPYPELLRKILGDAAYDVRILNHGVQHTPLELFSELGEEDILFIDSTHVLKTGSDVCFELFEVLPRLAKGVLVHFHDMFWPFEYPRPWVIEDNRSWNELYAVRAFLTNNHDWEIIMFNDYMRLFERPLIEATYPTFLRNSGGALWIQRRT